MALYPTPTPAPVATVAPALIAAFLAALTAACDRVPAYDACAASGLSRCGNFRSSKVCKSIALEILLLISVVSGSALETKSLSLKYACLYASCSFLAKLFSISGGWNFLISSPTVRLRLFAS